MALAMLIIGSAFADVIKGKVVESDGVTPMSQCTVRLLGARDSAFVDGTTTNENGEFRFVGVKNGRYVVHLSYIGYDNNSVRARLTDANPNSDLGTIKMKENTVVLKDLVVQGVKTEIKVKEDTVEYNADSYKTQPNAVVEDLLKRLPGVEVDSDGKITAQGKSVSKILIDGKEFFSDDPKVASKNIPVDMVDKLQVVDRKSDLARTTGVDDGEEETVINLTVKKGMNNGWFGTVTAGYGTDKRYGVSAMINHFWDGNQISFVGNANNTNNLGFSSGNEGRFRNFGGSNGINTSQSLGVNFNVGTKDSEKFRVGGDLMYSHSNKEMLRKLNREYLFADSSSFYNSATEALDRGHNVRGNFRLKWEIDSANTFEFRPDFSFNHADNNSDEISLTQAGDAVRTKVNENTTSNSSKGNSFEFRGELVFNHKFLNRPGRAFSAQVRYNHSNVKEDQNSFNKIVYRPDLEDSETDITQQIIDNHNWSNQVRTRLTWTEPLGDPAKGNSLVLAYHFDYKWNGTTKKVWDVNDDATTLDNYIDGRHYALARDLALLWGPTILQSAQLLNDLLETSYNDNLSNDFRNKLFTQRLQVGYKRVTRTYNLDLGFNINPAMQKSDNLSHPERTIATRWVWNVAPYLRFRYKFSKSSNVAADYRARFNQPSMAQLQPVADMSNPLRIVVGNPDLKPSFVNNFNVRMNHFDMNKQLSVMGMIRGSFTSNSIIQKVTYNAETGGQLTTYENVNGVWELMAMNMISFPFRNKHFQFVNNFFLRYNVGKGYTTVEQDTYLNTSNQVFFAISPAMTYRNDWMEAQLRPFYNINHTGNSVSVSNYTPNVHTYGGTLNLSFYTKFGLDINTDISYSGNKGYAKGYDTNQWIWNAQISYSCLAGKSLTFSAKAYDLLKQRQTISRSVTANYIQDQEVNDLSRYFMFTVSYKFNTFGGGKIPENKNADFNRRRW